MFRSLFQIGNGFTTKPIRPEPINLELFLLVLSDAHSKDTAKLLDFGFFLATIP